MHRLDLRRRWKTILSSLGQDGGADFWHRERVAGKLEIVLPTIDSAPFIDLILAYYRELRVPVTVFVDSKTTDNTAEIAKDFAVEVVTLSNATPRVGAMIERMSHHDGTEWVLRMDDDELPSIGMLRFIRTAISSRAYHVVGFPRYQVLLGADGRVSFDSTQDLESHRQWRLYRPDHVRYHGRGHSPGFDFNERRALKAPGNALMIHLDWVVHSHEERMRKLERYETHTPGHGWSRRDHYLGDAAPDLPVRLRPLPLKEFAWTSRNLAARFPTAVVEPA